MLTGWRPGVVDWSSGVFASCIMRVQLYINACITHWPQFALQHHWLLPINCHFLRLYSAAGRGIAAVSSAIEESDLYLFDINSRWTLCCFFSMFWHRAGHGVVRICPFCFQAGHCTEWRSQSGFFMLCYTYTTHGPWKARMRHAASRPKCVNFVTKVAFVRW